MTHRQQDSVTRYLDDASKIVFATAVVSNLVALERFSMVVFLIGVMGSAGCFHWAYWLEGERG